jgi:dihydroorotase
MGIVDLESRLARRISGDEHEQAAIDRLTASFGGKRHRKAQRRAGALRGRRRDSGSSQHSRERRRANQTSSVSHTGSLPRSGFAIVRQAEPPVNALGVAARKIGSQVRGSRYAATQPRTPTVNRTSALAALMLLPVSLLAQERVAPFDIVIAGGRVMDPESGLDAIRHIGIRAGKVDAISETPLTGRDTIDAQRLVVSPGFIDLHAHWQAPASYDFMALDGVTTALELEGGAFPIAPWYAQREGRARIHFGASVSHGGARNRIMRDSAVIGQALAAARTEQDSLEAGRPGAYRAASPEQMQRLASALEEELRAGGIGFGFGINYTPGATREEIYRLFALSARHGVTNFVHVRGAGLQTAGGTLDAMQEMISAVASTGASLHIVHVTSSSLRQTPLVIDMIEGARKRGLDISTEVYPYEAASTDIRSAIFDPGFRERIGIDYGNILWPATGERLTAASFERYRRTGGPIVIFLIPEDAMRAAIAHPLVMIASDGVPLINGQGHPRGVGTNARVLGRFVREEKLLPLMDALKKMTLMPAQRLEGWVPQMKTKGRLRIGADADITIFDPVTVIDRATYERPAQPSAGIVHVLVNGTLVVRNATLIPGAAPGTGIRRGP